MAHADSGGRRNTIRIQYPPHLAPEIEINHTRYTVVDLSANGCSLTVPSASRYRIGERLRVTLRFRDGATLPVEATVSRMDVGRVGLAFQVDIPQRVMERELSLFGDQGRDRRRFFRLLYGRVPGPILLCRGAVQFKVIEISEAAIVLHCEDLTAFLRGQQVMGSLMFHDRKPLPIIGNVFRLTADRIVVMLGRFIPTARIMQEQQYVLKTQRQ